MSARIDDDSAPDDELDECSVEDDEPDCASESQLPAVARRALLTNRFITRSRNRSAWDALLAYESEIRERLADMFLLLIVDRDYEVAFKRQDPAEDLRVGCSAPCHQKHDGAFWAESQKRGPLSSAGSRHARCVLRCCTGRSIFELSP
jgi:hypothetical protein